MQAFLLQETARGWPEHAAGLLSIHRQASPGSGHVAPLSCSARYAGQDPWVPAQPAGIDGHARLVPQQTPSFALICAYAGSNLASRQTGWALSGRQQLTGGLAALAAQLSWQPRSTSFVCPDVGGRQVNYLIGLTYRGGGRVWVAATQDPSGCTAASNGEFTSSGLVGPTVSQAFASGRWPARQSTSCNRHGQDLGRLGQGTVMVPASSVSLTICAPAAHVLTSGYQALTSALNLLPARPSTNTCSGAGGPAAPFYQLLFSYPQGPPVQVTIADGCRPAINNSSLQSPSASTIEPIISHLLTTK
jgi:hypothetical protein